MEPELFDVIEKFCRRHWSLTVLFFVIVILGMCTMCLKMWAEWR